MDKSFRFKQFTVANERAAMKVGTDGVLIGAWVRLRGDEQHILDVGTGTGVIALMLAQRTSQSDETQAQAATIIGIDIDKPSAEEAAANFKASPWAGRMAAFAGDFRGLGTDPSHPLKYLAFPYDLIVSNPPYFVDALKAPDPRRNDARHADSLTYADLVANAVRNLAPDGRLALILPSDAAARFAAEALACGLHLRRRTDVFTLAGTSPTRTLLEFSRTSAPLEETTLAIQDAAGFTDEYRTLTREFYLKF